MSWTIFLLNATDFPLWMETNQTIDCLRVPEDIPAVTDSSKIHLHHVVWTVIPLTRSFPLQ